jgi:outer membrane lipoprotein-sorting protein
MTTRRRIHFTPSSRSASRWLRGAVLAAAALLAPGAAPAAEPVALEELSGPEIVRKINEKPDGESLSQELRMELTSRSGEQRVREAGMFRKDFGADRKTILLLREPKNVKGTGFLTFDYAEAQRDDDQWLYLPALRKVRRISAADRGDDFLGTDFSYEDVKNGSKLVLEDYDWKAAGTEEAAGVRCYVLEGTAVSPEVAAELGYGRVRIAVDPAAWMPRRYEIWDVAGNPLKTVEVTDIRAVGGIWTAHELLATSHKTGHRTRFVFSDVRYDVELVDDLFDQSALERTR